MGSQHLQMSRNPALNPTSTPFFPGGNAFADDDLSPSPLTRDQPTSAVVFGPPSSSIPPPEYRPRAFRSSPSPTPDAFDAQRPRSGSSLTHRTTPDGIDLRPQGPPAIRQVRADRAYPGVELRAREMSLTGSVESMPEEALGSPSPLAMVNNNMPFRPRTGSASLREPFVGHAFSRSRESLGQPYSLSNASSRSPSFHTAQVPVLSTSPVSSAGSHGGASSIENGVVSFESQLQASPLIRDILERLMRCESTTRQIQTNLGDVNRKMDILLERVLTANNNAPPQFNDPFSSPSVGPNMGHRGSISAPIAPNQQMPGEDVNAINQRLNTLTTSMSQLLALQTQSMQNSGNSPLTVSQGMPHRPDISPSNTFQNSTPMFVPRGIKQATPNQNPNPLPSRTWSVGNLEPTLRGAEVNNASPLGRQDRLMPDKQRRSVMGLMRRDSVGQPLDSWPTPPAPAGPPQRADGNGPTLTKWDQLPLAPELLQSLTRFGVGPPNKIQQRALPFLLRGSDIIAQAPPTQERIAAYVIPAIQVVLSNINKSKPLSRGPLVVIVSTTVDQATQAQRMIRDYGGPIGVRSALGVGAASGDMSQELRLLQQNVPHIICGTPQKLHAIFTSAGGLSGGEVRFLVLDEVDQLIARNLHEYVFNIVKLFPAARARPVAPSTPGHTPQPSLESNGSAPYAGPAGRKYSGLLASPESAAESLAERQTALFSNTVPQDVLNLANHIELREPVRVLVRRDGTVTQADTAQGGARALRQYYLYLALPTGGRPDAAPAAGAGHGIIGSGRGATSAETAQAREWKLDALADLFDAEIPQAIIHVGGTAALDAVTYKLASKGVEAVALHPDMNAAARLAAVNKFRGAAMMRQGATRVLVAYDVQVKTTEVSQVPLVVNYDLPKAVEEYAHRVAPAVASNFPRAGVVVNFVTATGGDVEMLRSIECYYKVKFPEVPMNLRDVL